MKCDGVVCVFRFVTCWRTLVHDTRASLCYLIERKSRNDETGGIISVVQQIVQYLWSSSLVYKQAAVLWEPDRAPPFSLSVPTFPLWPLREQKPLSELFIQSTSPGGLRRLLQALLSAPKPPQAVLCLSGKTAVFRASPRGPASASLLLSDTAGGIWF